jgi:hypothetical protein
MDDQVTQLAQQLLKSGFDHFSERERRVITAIANRISAPTAPYQFLLRAAVRTVPPLETRALVFAVPLVNSFFCNARNQTMF